MTSSEAAVRRSSPPGRRQEKKAEQRAQEAEESAATRHQVGDGIEGSWERTWEEAIASFTSSSSDGLTFLVVDHLCHNHAGLFSGSVTPHVSGDGVRGEGEI